MDTRSKLSDSVSSSSLQVKIVPTPLRLNQTYSFYYNNAARLLFTGVVPFCLLMAFNYGIYKAVKRRRSAFAATSGGGGARGGGRGSGKDSPSYEI